MHLFISIHFSYLYTLLLAYIHCIMYIIHLLLHIMHSYCISILSPIYHTFILFILYHYLISMFLSHYSTISCVHSHILMRYHAIYCLSVYLYYYLYTIIFFVILYVYYHHSLALLSSVC